MQFKTVTKGNFDLAKWAHAVHVPSFEEYMEVGEEEISVCSTLAGIFMCMEQKATKEDYEWLKSRPKFIQTLCARCRLKNDITGFEVQLLNHFFTSGVCFYFLVLSNVHIYYTFIG